LYKLKNQRSSRKLKRWLKTKNKKMEDLKLVAEIIAYTISRPRRPVILSKNIINPSNGVTIKIGFTDNEPEFLRENVLQSTTVFKSWQVPNSETLLAIIKALDFQPNLDKIKLIDFSVPYFCVAAWLPYRD